MQRLVDDVLAATKESVKTITYESVNIIVRIINGISALLLAFLPGKATILEGIQGWELRPKFSGPRFPRWMENGVSSFNQFVYELSVDSDESSSMGYSSEEEEMNENERPPSPVSHSSKISRAGSFGRHNRRRISWIELMISWIFLPAKIFFYIPLHLFHLSYFRWVSSSDQTGDLIKRAQILKENIIPRTTDRRRGIIEDLHLAIEMFIESLFDVVQKAARSAFSPIEAIRSVWGWFSYESSSFPDSYGSSTDESAPTTTEEIEVEPETLASFQHSLNTDARTCQDVITELGYPYEAIHVITADGYVLLLERIPRRDARKAVYLQHGVFDSSMGWVSNGVVGSPAFAAYDQGYDVFLGNFRGLVSREHVNKNISSRQYWHYSVNQHGTEDIPAMIEKIYQVKTSELKLLDPEIEKETTTSDQSFKLYTICHSLGGAAMIMYVVTRQIEEKPHRLSRLILLSPAGFHGDSNLVFTVAEHLFVLFAPILAPLIPAFYIPTRFFRMLFNKLARDFYNYPAIGGLVQTIMSYFVGGDSSNWVGVLGMPHYNMNDMPGVSFQVALHLAQMKRAGRFMMFDYGSKSLNMEIYGLPEPLDVGEYYEFIDVPVDLVAGKKDKVIRPSMVRKHYKLMRNSGVDVSYREFEYAHLDFTFSHHEELLAYVMSRVRLVEPTEMSKRRGTTRSKSD